MDRQRVEEWPRREGQDRCAWLHHRTLSREKPARACTRSAAGRHNHLINPPPLLQIVAPWSPLRVHVPVPVSRRSGDDAKGVYGSLHLSRDPQPARRYASELPAHRLRFGLELAQQQVRRWRHYPAGVCSVPRRAPQGAPRQRPHALRPRLLFFGPAACADPPHRGLLCRQSRRRG
jgi:hypothetical protein